MRQRSHNLLVLCVVLGMVAGACATESVPDTTEPAPTVTQPAADTTEPAADTTEATAPEPVALPDEITLLVGFAPGGAFDLATQVVARHLPGHLPGEPNVIVEHRPGAGTMLAANATFNTEPQDGSVIATFFFSLIVEQAIGRAEGVAFDGREFQWLASMRTTEAVCFVAEHSAIDSIEDIMNGEELVVSATGPMSVSGAHPRLLNHVLGTNFRVVLGYEGLGGAFLALEGEEVDGICTTTDTALSLARLDQGVMSPIILFGEEPPVDIHPAYEGTPSIWDFGPTDSDIRLIDLLTAADRIYVPYAVGPDVPSDVVAVLRASFESMLMDPAFVADFEEAGGGQLGPSTGEEIEEVVDMILSTPQELLAQLGDALGIEE